MFDAYNVRDNFEIRNVLSVTFVIILIYMNYLIEHVVESFNL